MKKIGEYLIFTGTVTNALKGRDILRKNKIEAFVKKVANAQNTLGCGYAIVVKNNINKAENLLINNEVKILKISKNF